MHWFLDFIVRHRNISSLLLTVLLSMWMISGSPQTQAKAARVLTVSVFYPLQFCLNQITHFNNIFAENRKMKKEITELRLQVSYYQEAATENTRLRKLLNFAQDYTFNLLPVKVVARDPSPLYRTIVINAGKKDSVGMWMPIVGEQGVVGKVVQVMNNMSLIQLLTDPTNRTSVLNRRTRTVSILETENGTDFFIFCRRHEEVQPGDTIVTSGLGGIYPRGLPVGILTKIQDQDPLFQKVGLKLIVDFDHIEEMFVMKLAPQWAAFKVEMDSVELGTK